MKEDRELIWFVQERGPETKLTKEQSLSRRRLEYVPWERVVLVGRVPPEVRGPVHWENILEVPGIEVTIDRNNLTKN